MKIQDMHYDFKKKLNKVDSAKNRNLLVPEIDWVLNEAMMLFIRNSASPRIENGYGAEVNQSIRDDLRTLVKTDVALPLTGGATSLPSDYLHFLSVKVLSDKGSCSAIESRGIVRQHDDMFEEDPYTRSSVEWREINVLFNEEGIKTFTDGSFTNTFVLLSYVRQPKYMHYADGFGSDGYRLPSGELLKGAVDCELPEHTHRAIVDLAVAITAGELHYQDYQLKLQKSIELNQVK